MQGREGRAEAWEAQFPERDASVPRRRASQQGVFSKETPSQGPGDLTWSRQTSTPVRRRREATAREELVTGESKEEANSERRPQSSRRTPCPRSGDAGRGWKTIASGLAHRSAQHLTPLRGRPLRNEAAMEREGAEVLVQGPTL